MRVCWGKPQATPPFVDPLTRHVSAHSTSTSLSTTALCDSEPVLILYVCMYVCISILLRPSLLSYISHLPGRKLKSRLLCFLPIGFPHRLGCTATVAFHGCSDTTSFILRTDASPGSICILSRVFTLYTPFWSRCCSYRHGMA